VNRRKAAWIEAPNCSASSVTAASPISYSDAMRVNRSRWTSSSELAWFASRSHSCSATTQRSSSRSLGLPASSGIGTSSQSAARLSLRLFAHADERDLKVVAQFHSHRGQAYLSRSDLRHGFGVDGFTTTVVPYYESPPGDIAAWGWWTHQRGWQPTAPPTIGSGSARTIHFDEDGIRED
jgi:hypothetical protein